MWILETEKKADELPKVSELVVEKKLTVETVNNHIYFYAHVDTDRCLALIRAVRELDAVLRSEHISRGLEKTHPPVPIWLHIQSPGGGLFAGMSTSDELKQIETPVYSIVEGYCASAGTLISMTCAKRYIRPSAFMLIHQLSSVMWGKYEEFKDEMRLLDMAMDTLVAFYHGHSNLSEEEVKELLRRDSWFNSQECLERGLVDAILD